MTAWTLEWVERQFLNAPLGNRARSRRLASVAGAFAGGGADALATITSLMPTAAQSKGAYRLFDCPQLTHPNAIADHCRQGRQQLGQPGVYLLIEDTAAAALGGLKQCVGLGPIGEDYTRGFFLHTTLAVRWDPHTDERQLLGMAGQQAWARPMQRPGRRKSHGRGKKSNHARQPRPQRGSSRWAREAVAAKDSAGSTGQLIYVADRESDLYEVFLACEAAKLQRVIRLRHSRVLAGEDLEHPYLKDAAAAAAVRGHYTLDLPGQKRQAKLEVRSTQVQLRGPIRPGESGRTSDATWCV